MSKVKINKSYEEVIAIFQALRDMNGATAVVFDAGKGKDVSTKIPYQFTAEVTLTIARNLRLIGNVLDDHNSAIDMITGKKPAADLAEETKTKLEELRKSKVELELEPISTAGLRLDANRIPPGNISQLLPLLIDNNAPAAK